MFNQTVKPYQEAIEKSGYKIRLSFEPTKEPTKIKIVKTEKVK